MYNINGSNAFRVLLEVLASIELLKQKIPSRTGRSESETSQCSAHENALSALRQRSADALASEGLAIVGATCYIESMTAAHSETKKRHDTRALYHFSCPQSLWRAAKSTAALEGVSIRSVLIALLDLYVVKGGLKNAQGRSPEVR